MNEPASALYEGIVVHRRFGAKPHALRYRMTMALLDLDELDALDGSLRLFSRGGFNLFSFHDRDHRGAAGAADAGAVTLRAMVETHLATAGLALEGGAIRMLSLPRILGYAFNPLSVYFCYRAEGALAAILYEVNNTFGQRHTYLIPVAGEGSDLVRQRCEKAFYVSPFLDMDMVYDFRIAPPGEGVSVAIEGSRRGQPIIAASFLGRRRRLTDAALLRSFLSHPTLALTVVAGIHWEALMLWLKGVGLRPRPAPPDRAITIVPPREV